MGTFTFNQKKLDEKAAFVKWLVLPPRDRVPQTQTELAEELGVHSGTLSNWKREPDLRRKVNIIRSRELEKHDFEIFEALVQTAKQPGREGSTDRKTFFQLRGYLRGGMEDISEAGKTTNTQINQFFYDPDRDIIKYGIEDEALRVQEFMKEKGVDLSDEEAYNFVKERMNKELKPPQLDDDDLSDIGSVDQPIMVDYDEE